MHLAAASLDPPVRQGLTASSKSNHILVEQSFHSAPLGDNDLKYHTVQHGDVIHWNKHLWKNCLYPLWKGSYRVLLTNSYDTKLLRNRL